MNSGLLIGILLAFSFASQAFAENDSRTCGTRQLVSIATSPVPSGVTAVHVKLNVATMTGQVITWSGSETEVLHLPFQVSSPQSPVMALAQQYLVSHNLNSQGLLLTAFEALRTRPDQDPIGWVELADPESGVIQQNLIIYGKAIGKCTAPSTAVAI